MFDSDKKKTKTKKNQNKTTTEQVGQIILTKNTVENLR